MKTEQKQEQEKPHKKSKSQTTDQAAIVRIMKMKVLKPAVILAGPLQLSGSNHGSCDSRMHWHSIRKNLESELMAKGSYSYGLTQRRSVVWPAAIVHVRKNETTQVHSSQPAAIGPYKIDQDPPSGWFGFTWTAQDWSTSSLCKYGSNAIYPAWNSGSDLHAEAACYRTTSIHGLPDFSCRLGSTSMWQHFEKASEWLPTVICYENHFV